MSCVTFLYRRKECMEVDPSVFLVSAIPVSSVFVDDQDCGMNSSDNAAESDCSMLSKLSPTFRVFLLAMIVDSDSQSLKLFHSVDVCRKSLSLDSKRPTVNRRFLHDINGQIVQALERIVLNALVGRHTVNELSLRKSEHGVFEKVTNPVGDCTFFHVYCNRFVRILEYDIVGSGLAPHTDGSKICDVTRCKSTHTLLFYLSDCEMGGETVIVDNSHEGWSKSSQLVVPSDRAYKIPDIIDGLHHRKTMDVSHGCPQTHVCLGVSPRIGRVFLFPHDWPHAGAVCRSVPKNVLRAEITIQYSTTTLHGEHGT